MIITDDMKKVESLIKEGKHLFITGKAGSGKTTLLQKFQKDNEFDCVVVAPTGVAAINAGGVTIHNQFSFSIGFLDPTKPFEWRIPQSKKLVLKSAKYLIIDEISMVRCDIMDAIDKRLRSVRRNKKPFGGIQLLMFGDLMQLPPVVQSDEISALSEFYDDFFFFNAHVFENTTFEMVELSEIFRQTDDISKSFLNSIREGNITSGMSDVISSMLSKKTDDDKAIHLCSLRSVAETYNRKKLGQPTHKFVADIKGDFNEKNASCDLNLLLKVGARVMITKNDTDCYQYVNGTLGLVDKINSSNIIILTDNGKKVTIEPNTCESFKYDVSLVKDENTDEVKTVINKIKTGSCTQYPLTLAYAITIHKSQGLTFDNVVLHIKEIFQTGQLYTALSRCRSINNVSIDNKITKDMLSKNDTIENFFNIIKANNNVFIK